MSADIGRRAKVSGQMMVLVCANMVGEFHEQFRGCASETIDGLVWVAYTEERSPVIVVKFFEYEIAPERSPEIHRPISRQSGWQARWLYVGKYLRDGLNGRPSR